MKKIEERLTPPAVPEPPEALLERIQKEIPDHLHLVEEESESTFSARRLRLIAASVAVVVLGGLLALRVAYEPMYSMMPLDNQEAPSGRSVTETGPVDPASSVDTEGRASTSSAAERDAVQETGQARQDRLKRSPVEFQDHGNLTSEKAKVESPAVVDEQQNQLKALGYVSKSEHGEQVTLESAIEPKRSETRSRQEPPSAEPLTELEMSNMAETPALLADEVFADSYARPQEGREAQRRPGVAQKRVREVPPEGQSTAPPSTGGTHEPNDTPYGDMFLKGYGTNPFIDTEDDFQSTFGLDVDTGSFTLARSYIERGHLPPGEAIRVEEFVNYFDYGDPAPHRGEFTITAEGGPSPFATGPRYQLVRFGIKGREISAAERQPAMLIFVVDVSGSMGRENRLGLVKRSLELLLDQLQPEDQVGLVVYGSRGQVLLEPTSDKYAIERSIHHLVPNGSTNAEEGLTLAYDLARTYRRRGAINRIILCSDGVANVGRTGPESILQRIQSGADQGVELTTIGFGMGNYNDILMEQLADQGDGSYAYVDTLDEARRIFVENLTGTLQTIASDAKVQVEFNPETVSRYRLIGYENRDIADHRFRDDTVDAGEIGAGHQVTALYEIKLHENVGKRDLLATLRLRYRSKASGEVVETAVDLTRRNISKRWESASRALRLSSVVAEFAEILKGSYWAKEGSLDMLEQRAAGVAADYRGDREVQDLVTLIGQARRLTPISEGYNEDD
jgi:Ca-activated chloride channel family protein